MQARGRESPAAVARAARREHEAVLWHGPVLELSDRARLRLGPDILAEPPDLDAMLANLRALAAACVSARRSRFSAPSPASGTCG